MHFKSSAQDIITDRHIYTVHCPLKHGHLERICQNSHSTTFRRDDAKRHLRLVVDTQRWSTPAFVIFGTRDVEHIFYWGMLEYGAHMQS